jgi:hypothetical protein
MVLSHDAGNSIALRLASIIQALKQDVITCTIPQALEAVIAALFHLSQSDAPCHDLGKVREATP